MNRDGENSATTGPETALHGETVSRISSLLSLSHPGQDVRVTAGSVFYGSFVWDERSLSHVHMTTGDLFRALGFSFTIRSCLKSLPTVEIDDRVVR